MSKRKLNKQQKRRISDRQRASQRKAASNRTEELDESSLGPEQNGVIISHFGKQADIECEGTENVVRCHLRANLGDIVVGDKVIWRAGAEKEGVVVAIKERSSELCRPDSFGKLKLVAANVDQVIIVIAPEPEPFANLIDRYLISAENNDLEAVIVINKSDLISDNDICLSLKEKYSALGYPVLVCSSKANDNIEALSELVAKGCSIFVGQSGVGKSSIIGSFLPEQEIKVGQLSEGERKGKHTTTYARLYHFKNGGDCIDSPGIREFGLWHLNADQVAYGFREFREYLGNCKFRDCKHQNEPGCALLQALEDKLITQERFDSYRQIIESLDQVNIIDKDS